MKKITKKLRLIWLFEVKTISINTFHPEYIEPYTIGRRTTVGDGEVTFS